MRPQTLDGYVGQQQAVGDGSWLRRAIEHDTLSSVILYGPAGTGKTTLARIIANTTHAEFVEVSAISGTVKDLRREIDAAESRLLAMGEIKRHFRDKGWSVRVPRRLQELSAKVNQVTDELTNELSRSPSVDEIATRLGVSVDEVLEAMDALLTLLGAAGCNFIMGIPGADDIMLNYQSTSFHDAAYLRKLLGKRPAPEFEAWLEGMGIHNGEGALLPPSGALLGLEQRVRQGA